MVMKKMKFNFKDTLIKPIIVFQFLVIISLVVLTSLLYTRLQSNLIPEVRVLSDRSINYQGLLDELNVEIDLIRDENEILKQNLLASQDKFTKEVDSKLVKNTQDLENKIKTIPKGDTGDTGPQGPIGPKGDTGGMTSSELSRLISAENSISSIKNDISSMKGFGWSSISGGTLRDINDIDNCLNSVRSYLNSLGGYSGISVSVSEGYFGFNTSVSVPNFYGYSC
jgi:hypothetical protein